MKRLFTFYTDILPKLILAAIENYTLFLAQCCK